LPSQHLTNGRRVKKPIQVIVIDDSAFMRRSLSLMLESDPNIKIVATARDGRDGLEKIEKFRPDLVTLDVEMPGMDGLTALKVIMKEMPVPVLMVSSLTTEGAEVTLEALHLGAVDFISKDLSFVSVDILRIKEELIAKVKEITSSRYIQLQFQMLKTGKSAERKPEVRTPVSRGASIRFPGTRPEAGRRTPSRRPARSARRRSR